MEQLKANILKNKVKIFILFCFIVNLSCNRSHGDRSQVSPINSVLLIRSLQAQYAHKHNGEFASSFDKLIKKANLSEQFSGEKPIINAYVFTMKTRKSSTINLAFYSINADPIKSDNIYEFSEAIHYYYYFDSTLDSIKFTEENRPANANDPSI